MMLHQRTRVAFAFIAMALAMSTSAFLVQPPTMASTRIRTTAISQPNVSTNANLGSRPELFLSNLDDEDDNDLKEDWKTLTKAAGDIARKIGGKVAHVIQEGGSKLKDLATRGAERVTSTLLPDPEISTQQPQPDMDTQDEDLFRSLLGDEALFVAPSKPSPFSLYPVMDQAALLLAKDEVATKLLGSSPRWGQPFSQTSWSSSINGRSTTTLRASFEVWGSQGEGIASVSSTDGTLTDLDLQVHGIHHRVDNNMMESPIEQPHHTEDDGAMEVEVMEGFHCPGARGGSVMDAEILDEKY